MDRFKDFIDDKFVRKLLLIALVPFVLGVVAYFVKFGLFLKLPISSNQGDWGTFGDFVGGVLNPIYAFLAFTGVLYTVLLQKEQIETTKTQKKLEEIQQLILGVSSAIDKVLYEQKYKYRDVDTPAFTLLRAISNDSTMFEIYPSLPSKYKYRETRESILCLISYDLVYIEQQLAHMVWCIQIYRNNTGSKDVEDFYVGKYRDTVFMMKQIECLHLQEVEDFFKADEVKKAVFDAIIAEKSGYQS